ncbi:MAG: DUF4097 family beta strand repeat protein [Oscillospiraceae bacterium]|nr:DUF4097 family beta strand repeat protein [Oscillospiraceae bacterium]
MDKLTYLAELAEGLARWVPERERQDILRYYAEYFEEAGPDREAQVVAELGDPWALSCRLAVEGGYVTWQQANSWTPPKKKKWPWLVAGVVLAAAALIAVPAAMMASAVGRFVGGNVASRFSSEPQAIVEAVDNGQFGIAEDLPGTCYEEADGSGGFWSMEDGYLEPFHEIDVDAGIANVTVTGGEDYTLFISSDSTLGGYRLKWEVKNGVLKIRDDGGAGHVNITSWDDFKNIFGIDASAMDVIITVPDGAQIEKLKAKTGLGDVFASGLEVVGKLEAETGLGDIECYEVRAHDEVDLESGMGDVSLGVSEAYSGVEFDAKTGMGTVEVQVDGYEKDWDYEAKTGMGTVIVNGDSRGTKVERKGKGDYKLEAESGMGDVQLYFRDDRW